MGHPFYDQGHPEFTQRPDDPGERGSAVRSARPLDGRADN